MDPLKMYFLLTLGIFQPAMLVYRRVTPSMTMTFCRCYFLLFDQLFSLTMTAFSSLNFCLSLAVEFSPDIHTLQRRTSAVGNMIIVSDFLNDLRSNKKHADVPQEKNFSCLIAWSKPANQLGLVDFFFWIFFPKRSSSKYFQSLYFSSFCWGWEGCRWEVNSNAFRSEDLRIQGTPLGNPQIEIAVVLKEKQWRFR